VYFIVEIQPLVLSFPMDQKILCHQIFIVVNKIPNNMREFYALGVLGTNFEISTITSNTEI
jgi:hypothetical protein